MIKQSQNPQQIETRATVRLRLIRQLQPVFGDNARTEADALLQLALNTSDSFVLTADVKVTEKQITSLEHLTRSRVEERKPVSRIRGERAFWSHVFHINEHVLDPRPDSETLVEAAQQLFSSKEQISVLDLGTGSGCLLLSVLSEFPNATGLGIDASEAAIKVAVGNAQKLDLSHRASFTQGSWFDDTPVYAGNRFDIVLCNPPYIDHVDKAWMQPEVLQHDPHRALFAEDKGFADYAQIFPQLHSLLKPAGTALFEHGFQQREALIKMAKSAGLQIDAALDDLGGNPRCLALSYPF